MATHQFADIHRPTKLSEVIGQDIAIQQIKGMLKQKQIPHCILVSGPYGTGKTTLTRILARLINKSKQDIHEIRLGEKKGIDDIREIVQQSQFKPQNAPYSIFIIDEIAKATSQAFDPLLKSLEEPPKQTIFILTTNEPERIPPPILSRCYRIQLGAFKKSDLKTIVNRVTEQERLKISKKSLNYVLNNAFDARTALQWLQMVRDAGGNETKFFEQIKQVTEGVELLAVKILAGLYKKKEKLVFAMLLKDYDPHSLMLNCLKYNEWLMRHHVMSEGPSWKDSYALTLQKNMEKLPALNRLSHTHNVLINIKTQLFTISQMDQKNLVIARVGALVFTV